MHAHNHKSTCGWAIESLHVLSAEWSQTAETSLMSSSDASVPEELEYQTLLRHHEKEEAAFRRDCPDHAAALEYASKMGYPLFDSVASNRWKAADPEAAEMDRRLQSMFAAVMDAENALKAAQVALDVARAKYRVFYNEMQPKISAARSTADMLCSQQLFAEATRMPGPVAPHFIATAYKTAQSICGCVVLYRDAHIYCEPDSHSDPLSYVADASVPAACHQHLCYYHRKVAPIAADEICRMFCAAMDAAGVSIPEHSKHAFAVVRKSLLT